VIASRGVRRVLGACVVSNLAFAALGLVHTTATAAPHVVAATRMHVHAPTTVTSPTPALISDTPRADTPSAQSKSAAPSASPSLSSRQSPRTSTSTTRPADAADDVTGIASSAAPPTAVRVAPNAGHYPAIFSGSASVNGRSQSVPASGAVVFTPTGSDLRQSSPDTPGDVKLTQRFSAGEAKLVSFQMKAGDSTKVFTPSQPVTFIPYGDAQGSTWSWSASSSDGATHISVTARVGGSKLLTVGGTTVTVFEVVTSLSISGDISGTAELSLWASNEYRAPVVQRQVINAKGSSGYGFSTKLSSDVTQTLTQLTPQ
jgi:hypothetical protein